MLQHVASACDMAIPHLIACFDITPTNARSPANRVTDTSGSSLMAFEKGASNCLRDRESAMAAELTGHAPVLRGGLPDETVAVLHLRAHDQKALCASRARRRGVGEEVRRG